WLEKGESVRRRFALLNSISFFCFFHCISATGTSSAPNNDHPTDHHNNRTTAHHFASFDVSSAFASVLYHCVSAMTMPMINAPMATDQPPNIINASEEHSQLPVGVSNCFVKFCTSNWYII